MTGIGLRFLPLDEGNPLHHKILHGDPPAGAQPADSQAPNPAENQSPTPDQHQAHSPNSTSGSAENRLRFDPIHFYDEMGNRADPTCDHHRHEMLSVSHQINQVVQGIINRQGVRDEYGYSETDKTINYQLLDGGILKIFNKRTNQYEGNYVGHKISALYQKSREIMYADITGTQCSKFQVVSDEMNPFAPAQAGGVINNVHSCGHGHAHGPAHTHAHSSNAPSDDTLQRLMFTVNSLMQQQQKMADENAQLRKELAAQLGSRSVESKKKPDISDEIEQLQAEIAAHREHENLAQAFLAKQHELSMLQSLPPTQEARPSPEDLESHLAADRARIADLNYVVEQQVAESRNLARLISQSTNAGRTKQLQEEKDLVDSRIQEAYAEINELERCVDNITRNLSAPQQLDPQAAQENAAREIDALYQQIRELEEQYPNIIPFNANLHGIIVEATTQPLIAQYNQNFAAQHQYFTFELDRAHAERIQAEALVDQFAHDIREAFGANEQLQKTIAEQRQYYTVELARLDEAFNKLRAKSTDDINEAHAHLNQVSEELRRAQEDLEAARREKTVDAGKIKDRETQIATLEARKDSLERDLTDMEFQRNEASIQAHNATAALRAKEEKLRQKQQEVARLQGQLDTLEPELDDLKTRFAQSERKVEQANQTIHALEERIEQKDDEIAAITAAKADVAQALADKTRELSALATSHDEENRALQASVKEKQREYAALETRLASATDEKDALQKELASARASAKALRKTSAESERKAREAEETAKSLHEQLTDLSQENHRSRLESLYTTPRAPRTETERNIQLQKENETLTSQLAQNKARLSELEASLEELKAKKDTMTSASVQTDLATQSVTPKHDEASSLRAEIKALERTIERQQATIDTLSTREAMLSSQILSRGESSSASITSSTVSPALVGGGVDPNAERVEKLEARLAQLQAEKEANTKLEKEFDELKEKNKSLLKQVAEMRQLLEKLKVPTQGHDVQVMNAAVAKQFVHAEFNALVQQHRSADFEGDIRLLKQKLVHRDDHLEQTEIDLEFERWLNGLMSQEVTRLNGSIEYFNALKAVYLAEKIIKTETEDLAKAKATLEGMKDGDEGYAKASKNVAEIEARIAESNKWKEHNVRIAERCEAEQKKREGIKLADTASERETKEPSESEKEEQKRKMALLMSTTRGAAMLAALLNHDSKADTAQRIESAEALAELPGNVFED